MMTNALIVIGEEKYAHKKRHGRRGLGGFFLALLVLPALAQQEIPQPTGSYYGGIVLSDNFKRGIFYVPGGAQMDLRRFELTIHPEGGAQFMRESNITECYGQAASSSCYGRISYTMNYGPGLANDEYGRIHGAPGSGPVIVRKSAVRGDPNQWAVWNEQINMGPGAKAALWIQGDNPEIEGRGYDTVPNVIVIGGNLNVTNASIQRNAPAWGAGAVLRVFRGHEITAELMEDGTLRIRRLEWLR